MVHLYTIPSSVPTKNIVSSFGLNATHLPLSENYYYSATIIINHGLQSIKADIIKQNYVEETFSIHTFNTLMLLFLWKIDKSLTKGDA